ncbi:MAG: DUF951 domain-containing protein [Clostridia bacterium]|nr:DUF951 domain-containing protein [Clostridia bacterium]
MRPPLELHLGDVVRLRKPHPCGSDRWEIVRVGADLRLRCLGCGRLVLIERSRAERRIREIVSRGAADRPRTPGRDLV